MLLSDIFSIPFLICLAICILLIGCSSIYFYQRITQQDHKIASMVSLISSMAEDEKVPIRVVPIATPPTQQQQQTQNIVIDISQKIPVSDDSESDTDASSDASSDTSDDTSDASDSEYSSTTTEDNEDKEQDDEQEDGEKVDLRIMSHIDLIIDDDAIDLDYEPIDDATLDDATLEDIGATLEDVMDKLEENNTDNTIKSIHLEEDGLTDFSIFKSISIMPDASSSSETVDFKKMSLSKLREIQGYGDLSKLKKIDILKLLGIE